MFPFSFIFSTESFINSDNFSLGQADMLWNVYFPGIFEYLYKCHETTIIYPIKIIYQIMTISFILSTFSFIQRALSCPIHSINILISPAILLLGYRAFLKDFRTPSRQPVKLAAVMKGITTIIKVCYSREEEEK